MREHLPLVCEKIFEYLIHVVHDILSTAGIYIQTLSSVHFLAARKLISSLISMTYYFLLAALLINDQFFFYIVASCAAH